MTQKSNGAPVPKNSKDSAKKPYVMPKSLQVKVKANAKYKDAIYSASGLVKFAKSPDGEKILKPVLEDINAKHGTSFKTSQIDTRLWKAYGTDKELNKKDGTPKNHFSFWLLINLINRKCKAMAEQAKQKVTTTTETPKTAQMETAEKKAA